MTVERAVTPSTSLLKGLRVSGDASVWTAGNATRGEAAQVLWNLISRIRWMD